MIKRILLLGHSGFIGQNLLRYFQEHSPRVEVHGFSAPQYDLTRVNVVEKISKYVTSHTAVVMLSGIKPSVGDTLDTCMQNISMTMNVCHMLEKYPVPRFIFMSSAGVYGEDIENVHISEKTPVIPRSYYGIAKYTSELLLNKVFDKKKGKGLIILRPPAVYGPSEKTFSYNPTGLLNTIQKGKTVTLWGDGSEKREFIYIDDIVKLIHGFVFHSFSGIINVASGRSYTFQEIVSTIEKILEIKIKKQSRKRSKIKVDNIFNNRLLQEVIPKFRFTNLEDGLLKIISLQSENL